MPIYEYRCSECKEEYEVFHKGKEVEEEVICPECSSTSHTRLMSVAGVAVKNHSYSQSLHHQPTDACENGSCCGGSCNFN